MKISEVIADTSSEDKALARLDVQKANLNVSKAHKVGKPKPQKPSRPSRPKGSIPSRPPLRPIS